MIGQFRKNTFIKTFNVSSCPYLLMCLLWMILVAPAVASAQDGCTTLGNNPEWTNGLQQLIETMKRNDMQTAKMQSKALSKICESAPALNYLQGKIADALDERTQALYFYQKASENTYKFAVEPDIAQKIWYARYEAEHPENSKDSVTSTNNRLDTLAAENIQLKTDMHAHYGTLLWTGVGLGIGGVVLTSVGAALAVMNSPAELIEENQPDISHYKLREKPIYAFAWASVGIGAGLLVTGAVLAGVYGYKYAQSKPEHHDITFHISPMHFSFDMRF